MKRWRCRFYVHGGGRPRRAPQTKVIVAETVEEAMEIIDQQYASKGLSVNHMWGADEDEGKHPDMTDAEWKVRG